MNVELITRPGAWRDRLRAARQAGQSVGLVTTMGALHAGHMSLIRRAAGACDFVAVTDYVNPLQFGAGEDVATYPRDLEHDLELAGEAGADLLFAPAPDDLWERPPATTVSVAGVSSLMEGASRPGHFDGVATIVAKLFALAGPCLAYFGEKDFQQLAVVRRLTEDLSLPVDIVGCPTVRDTDGLALSSRNAYLTTEEREVAPNLFYALLAAKRALEDDGVVDPAGIREAMVSSLARHPLFQLDYAEVVDPNDLVVPARITGEVRLCIAARLGRARLIDNISATGAES